MEDFTDFYHALFLCLILFLFRALQSLKSQENVGAKEPPAIYNGVEHSSYYSLYFYLFPFQKNLQKVAV